MNEQIAKAFVELQSELGQPPMNSKNPFFNSKYTDLKTAIDYYRPFLAKHGLSIAQTFNMTAAEKPTLCTIIVHESGETMESNLVINLPADPQKAGSYITYMRRYALNAIMNCAGDPDDDGNSISQGKKSPPKHTEPAPKKTDGPVPWTDKQRDKLFRLFRTKAFSDTDMKAFRNRYIPNKDKATTTLVIDSFDDKVAEFTSQKEGE